LLLNETIEKFNSGFCYLIIFNGYNISIAHNLPPFMGWYLFTTPGFIEKIIKNFYFFMVSIFTILKCHFFNIFLAKIF